MAYDPLVLDDKSINDKDMAELQMFYFHLLTFLYNKCGNKDLKEANPLLYDKFKKIYKYTLSSLENLFTVPYSKKLYMKKIESLYPKLNSSYFDTSIFVKGSFIKKDKYAELFNILKNYIYNKKKELKIINAKVATDEQINKFNEWFLEIIEYVGLFIPTDGSRYNDEKSWIDLLKDLAADIQFATRQNLLTIDSGDPKFYEHYLPVQMFMGGKSKKKSKKSKKKSKKSRKSRKTRK